MSENLDGILLVDKPSGITSYQVIRELKKYIKGAKVGHTGTLDPLATGLLVTVWGKATKIVPFLEEEPKVYEATLLAGVATDTLDITGRVIEEKYVSIAKEAIYSCFKSMEGRQEQLPPQYSALKRRGRPLYSYARSGEVVELSPRTIEIFSMKVLDIREELGKTQVHFRVSCSKGTYIRSLCRDIGLKLGVGACLKGLRRIRAGDFDVSQAMPLEKLLKMLQRGQDLRFIPIAESLAHLPRVYVSGDLIRGVVNGMSLPVGRGLTSQLRDAGGGDVLLVMDELDRPLAIHRFHGIDSHNTEVLRVIGL